jgi:hypothetical protein
MNNSNKSTETAFSSPSDDPNQIKRIEYKLDKYIITIKLSIDNKFIAVEQIKINKQFLDFKKTTSTKNFHDVNEFYEDDK